MMRTVLMCCRALVIACSLVVLVGSGALVQRTGAREHQSTGAQTATGLIAGRVLDVTSGQPVAGTTVVLRAVGRIDADISREGKVTVKPPPAVVTDSQGRFAYPSLLAGRYTLQVQREGYAPVRGAGINLGANQVVTDVELQVGRHSVITGTVRDDAGDPVVGIGVTAFSRRYLGFRPMLVPGRGAASNDRGEFRIADLPPGDYLLCACSRDSLPIDKGMLNRIGDAGIAASSVARQLNGAVLTFPPTFHPGTTRVADAVSITIGFADERRGIDITMQPAPGRRVSGRLVGGGPDASTTHTLTLVAADDDPTAIGIAEMPAVRMTPEGAFDFAGVPPGKYTLEAYRSDGKKGPTATVPVTVTDRDLADVQVILREGTTVKGRVEFAGAAARPDGDTLEKARVSLVPIVITAAVLMSIGSSGSVGHSSVLARDGSFTIEDVPPGRYMVNAGQFGRVWQTIESVITPDERSLHPVLVVGPSGVDALVVTMSDEALATLEVTLELGKYELPGEVRVALFPVDSTFWSGTYLAPARFPVSSPNNNGVASFSGVPAGDYYLVESSLAQSVLSPERMAEFARSATTVRLRPGEKTTVALKR